MEISKKLLQRLLDLQSIMKPCIWYEEDEDEQILAFAILPTTGNSS